MARKNPNLLTLTSGEAFQPFRYSVGLYGSRFFKELKDNKRFMAVRCPACRRVYVPPRPVCGPCFREMKEWVEVGPRGTIATYTVLRFAFIDPETGQKRPVPYGYGLIRLDGADTNLQHFLELPKDSPVGIGSRVQPVFEDIRHGNLRDIRHFEIIRKQEVKQMETVKAQTIGELLANQAMRQGEKTFLIFRDQEISYQELERIANAMAHEIMAAGIKKGERVAILLPNCPEFLYYFLGVMKAGAVAVPVNIVLKPPEIEFILNNAQASGLVIGSMLGSLSKELKAACASIRWLKEVEEAKPKELRLDLVKNLPQTQPPISVGPLDPASIIYTSGTTGFPKGAVLTHHNYLFDVEQFAPLVMNEGDRFLCVLPLFHVNAQVVTTLAPLYMGGSMILMDRFTPKEFFPALAKHKATAFSAVPSIYAVLLNLPDAEKYDLSSLRFCVCGAAPMPVPVFEAFEKKFKAKILEGYGLSEGTCVSSVNPLGGTRKVGSIGLSLPNQPMKIVNDKNEELETGKVGEIVIQGDNVMAGYFNNPQATAETLRGGWLNTGDLGYKDKDGYFFIVGRKKEMIIRAGENIYPSEVEAALYKHPAVAEAAVVGLPDERWGEEVAAFIIVKEGQSASAREIVSHCRSLIADYKCPKKIEFVPALPKTATGKIQKVKLKEDYLKANGVKSP